jgi:hypothetical protein
MLDRKNETMFRLFLLFLALVLAGFLMMWFAVMATVEPSALYVQGFLAAATAFALCIRALAKS